MILPAWQSNLGSTGDYQITAAPGPEPIEDSPGGFAPGGFLDKWVNGEVDIYGKPVTDSAPVNNEAPAATFLRQNWIYLAVLAVVIFYQSNK